MQLSFKVGQSVPETHIALSSRPHAALKFKLKIAYVRFCGYASHALHSLL